MIWRGAYFTTAASRNRKSAFEKAVQKEAAKRPPRVRYEPARPPLARPIDFKGQYAEDPNAYLALYELGGPRPEHRVMEVPVLMNMPASQLVALGHLSALGARYHTERFVAEEWDCDIGRTRVRWWNWKPLNDALKPEQWNAANRAMAYAERVKECLAYHGFDQPRELPGWVAGRGWLLRDIHTWVGIVLEDLEQLTGRP